MTIDLAPLLTTPARAADLIEQCGWTQGQEEAPDGSLCLTGGLLRACTIPGDGHLLVQVERQRGRAESWNDDPARTRDDVLAELRRPVTGTDLADTFGPQWQEIVTLTRRVAAMTRDEAWRAAAAWDAAMGATMGAAARTATRDAAWDAARYAAMGATMGAARTAARGAARGAALALSVRDLRSPDGFTDEHYRTLTTPLASVIGPLHPDDERDGLYQQETP